MLRKRRPGMTELDARLRDALDRVVDLAARGGALGVEALDHVGQLGLGGDRRRHATDRSTARAARTRRARRPREAGTMILSRVIASWPRAAPSRSGVRPRRSRRSTRPAPTRSRSTRPSTAAGASRSRLRRATSSARTSHGCQARCAGRRRRSRGRPQTARAATRPRRDRSAARSSYRAAEAACRRLMVRIEADRRAALGTAQDLAAGFFGTRRRASESAARRPRSAGRPPRSASRSACSCSCSPRQVDVHERREHAGDRAARRSRSSTRPAAPCR